MKKLSDYKGYEAIEKMADLLEPINNIMLDDTFKDLVRGMENNDTMPVIKYLLKNHAKEVHEVMAILEGVPAEEYNPNLLTLPLMLMEILNDSDLLSLFTSQA